MFRGYSNTHNPWETLGLQPGASEQEVKNAYKSLAKKCHPDKGGSAEEFKKINEAYTQIMKGEDPMEAFSELGEIFKLFGMLSGLNLGGMGGNSIGHLMKGPTVNTQLSITLEELELGGIFGIRYKRQVPTGKMQSIVSKLLLE